MTIVAATPADAERTAPEQDDNRALGALTFCFGRVI
jgi:hypothetical protein